MRRENPGLALALVDSGVRVEGELVLNDVLSGPG